MAPSSKKLQWLAINRDAAGVFSAASNATIKHERYLSAKTSNRRCRTRPLEAERVCTTDALGYSRPNTLLLIPTPRLRHLKPGRQDRHNGADDSRDRRTANHKSSAVQL